MAIIGYTTGGVPLYSAPGGLVTATPPTRARRAPTAPIAPTPTPLAKAPTPPLTTAELPPLEGTPLAGMPLPGELGTELPFPTTQVQMAEYQEKYTFDPTTKKWYEKAPVTAAPTVAPTAEPTPTPTAPTAQTYSIKSGDTLSGIAQQYGTTVDALMAANPQITDPNLIYAGATLSIPTGVAPTPAPTAPTAQTAEELGFQEGDIRINPTTGKQERLSPLLTSEGKDIWVPVTGAEQKEEELKTTLKTTLEQTPTTPEAIKQQMADIKEQVKALEDQKKIVEMAEAQGLTVLTPEELEEFRAPTPIAPPTAPTAPIAVPTEEMPSWLSQLLEGFQTTTQAGMDAMRAAGEALAQSYTSIADAITDRPSMVDEFNRLMEQVGIPEQKAELARLTSRATQIEEQIEALPEDVKARVQNFLMTQAQYQRVTASEAEPLTKLYNAIARAAEAKGAEIQANRQQVMDVMSLWTKDIERSEEALQWGLEGAKSMLELETRLAEKNIEFARIPFEIGLQYGLAAEEFAREAPEREADIAYREAQIAKIYTDIAEGLGGELLSPAEAATLGVPYGTTKEQAAEMGITPVRYKEPIVPTGVTGANYNTRLSQEISAMYAGRYGEEGAREKVIDILKREFPNIDIASDIYSRVPDGYEAQIKKPEATSDDFFNSL